MRTKISLAVLPMLSLSMLACQQEETNPVKPSESGKQQGALAASIVVQTDNLPLIGIVYSNLNAGGTRRYIVENISDMRTTRFDDVATSISVHKGPNYDSWKAQHPGIEPAIGFCTNLDYNGSCRYLTIGLYSDLRISGLGINDAITSVLYATNVPDQAQRTNSSNSNVSTYSSIPIIAELYGDPNYSGPFFTLIEGVSDLGSTFGYDNFASSLFVKKGPNWTSGNSVTFYDGLNFTQGSTSIDCDNLSINQIGRGYTNLSNSGMDDNISSVHF